MKSLNKTFVIRMEKGDDLWTLRLRHTDKAWYLAEVRVPAGRAMALDHACLVTRAERTAGSVLQDFFRSQGNRGWRYCWNRGMVPVINYLCRNYEWVDES